MNKNNQIFEALNDKNNERKFSINDDRRFFINDVKIFFTNAHALAVARLISLFKFQKFRKFEKLTHQTTK